MRSSNRRTGEHEAVYYSKEHRLTLAQEAVANHTAGSVLDAAKQFDVPRTTLQDRLHGITSHREAQERRQRLPPAAEKALQWMIIRLIEQGHPPRYSTIRELAFGWIQTNSATSQYIQPLGVNWHEGFMARHPDLRAKWSRAIDQQRAFTNNPSLIYHWFQLFSETKARYNIADEDVWNIDEKGYMMGVSAGAKVVLHRSIKEAFTSMPGNREWVTCIEAVRINGEVIPPYIIFKGKQTLSEWWEEIQSPQCSLYNACIGVSTNGWSDSDHGRHWIEKIFQKHT